MLQFRTFFCVLVPLQFSENQIHHLKIKLTERLQPTLPWVWVQLPFKVLGLILFRLLLVPPPQLRVFPPPLKFFKRSTTPLQPQYLYSVHRSVVLIAQFLFCSISILVKHYRVPFIARWIAFKAQTINFLKHFCSLICFPCLLTATKSC